MLEAEWWDYDDAAELAEAVAGDAGFIIESALDARGQALIALPGDAASVAILEKLAQAKLDWKQVTIIPTDDLLVAVDNPQSQVARLAKIFLPRRARVLPIATENADYRVAGRAADARLADLHWPPDLVWLGVGDNGETAGMFAGPDLDEALNGPKARRALGVMPDPLPADAPAARVTLSAAAILAARTVLIVLAGKQRRQVLEQAITDGPLSATPIGRILAGTELPIDIHWQNS